MSLLDATCGACGRAIPRERASCLYCGWSSAAADSAYGALVPAGTFTQGARLWRFAVASAAAVPLGAWLLAGAARESSATLLGLGLLALVPGPVAFGVQLLRRGRGPVAAEQRGVRVGERVHRWEDVEGVQLAGCPLRTDALELFGRAFAFGGGAGRVIGTLLGTRHLLGLLFLPLVVVLEVLVPAVVLLSPWCPRAVLRLRSGDALALADLDDPLGFERCAVAALDGPGAKRRRVRAA